MINKINFSNINSNKNLSVSFNANINTRKLLELAEQETDTFVRNGKALVEKIGKDKATRLANFQKKYKITPYKTYKSCTRKSGRYDNEALAEKAARAVEKKTGIEFSTYRCPICEKWHICKAVNKFIRDHWD